MPDTSANKLLEFQKKVGAIEKSEINPFFKSKYFDINKLIEVIKPILLELELVLVQPIIVVDDKNVLSTELHDDKSILLVSTIILPDNIEPQKMGSAITYYRRYAIQSMLLLQAEDDDSNKVSEQPNLGAICANPDAEKREPAFSQNKTNQPRI